MFTRETISLYKASQYVLLLIGNVFHYGQFIIVIYICNVIQYLFSLELYLMLHSHISLNIQRDLYQSKVRLLLLLSSFNNLSLFLLLRIIQNVQNDGSISWKIGGGGEERGKQKERCRYVRVFSIRFRWRYIMSFERGFLTKLQRSLSTVFSKFRFNCLFQTRIYA